MKRISFLFLVAMLTFLASCSEDGSNNELELQVAEIMNKSKVTLEELNLTLTYYGHEPFIPRSQRTEISSKKETSKATQDGCTLAQWQGDINSSGSVTVSDMVVINNLIRDYDANSNDQVDLPSEYTGTSPSLSKVDLAAEISYFDVSAASGDHLDLHDKDIIGDYLLKDCND